jgi:hypothetical protein
MCNAVTADTIQKALEGQGLDVTCYQMSEHGHKTTYRIILRGVDSSANFFELTAQVMAAIGPAKSVINMRRQSNGQIIVTATVIAPKEVEA